MNHPADGFLLVFFILVATAGYWFDELDRRNGQEWNIGTILYLAGLPLIWLISWALATPLIDVNIESPALGIFGCGVLVYCVGYKFSRRWPPWYVRLIWLGSFFAALIVWAQIDKSVEEKEGDAITARAGHRDLSEVGYILDVSRSINFSRLALDVAWSVKIPQTNRIYGCLWQSGFWGFKENDGVLLIHNPEEPNYGFIVGLHGKEQDRPALIWIAYE